jgi:hypothetical protein
MKGILGKVRISPGLFQEGPGFNLSKNFDI